VNAIVNINSIYFLTNNTWTAAPLTSTVGGDPHLSTFGGTRFNYQGECELVFAQLPHFHGKQGLTIHLRSKIEHVYSFIEGMYSCISVAVMFVCSCCTNIFFPANSNLQLLASSSVMPSWSSTMKRLELPSFCLMASKRTFPKKVTRRVHSV